VRSLAKIARNCSCHLIGPPDPASSPADPSELDGLVVGEVVGVLQQRPPAALEVAGVAVIGELAQRLPEVAADLVESVADELDDVKRIRAHDCLGGVAVRGDGLDERGAEIQRDRFDSPGTLGSELIEEPVEGLGVLALGTPDDLAAVVVDNEGQVLVVAPPADLVDPDAEQPVESPGVELGVDDALAGPTNGSPRHPTQPGDRRLVHPRRQPRDEVVEVAGQVRARAGERDRFDDDPVGRARQPPQGGLDLDRPRAQVEVSPRRRARPGVVAGRRLVTTMRAHQPAAAQLDSHGDHVDPEDNRGDVHPLEAQKALECSRDAHGRETSLVLGFSTSNLGLSPCASRGPSRTPTTARPRWPDGPQPTHTRVRRA